MGDPGWLDHRMPIRATSMSKARHHFEMMLDIGMRRHGDGEFISTMEMLGAIEEEAYEFKKAIHSKDLSCVKEEALDLMVSAFWVVASLENWKDGRRKDT